jgi:ribosome-associated protein
MKKSLKRSTKSSKKKPTKKGGEELARDLARVIDEKKGLEIIIFDLRGISPITDFFVVANGLSEIHVRTIAGELSDFERPYHVEGYEAGTWVLMDYVDVIVHLFVKETRQFYGLERLWGDAPQVDFLND